MYYNNFDDNITAKWRIVCEGWPLQKFCSPANLSTRNEVELLLNSWKSGTTKFRRLGDEEFENWEQERFRAAVNEVMGNEDDTQRSNSNVDSPPTQQREVEQANSPQHAETHPNPASQPASSSSTSAGAKRPSQEPNGPAISKKSKPAPLRGSAIINTLTSINGTPINTMKAPRKERSDKGKKRGPRKKTT